MNNQLLQWFAVTGVAVFVLVAILLSATLYREYNSIKSTGFAVEVLRKRVLARLGVTGPHLDYEQLLGRKIMAFWSVRWGPSGWSCGRVTFIDTQSGEINIKFESPVMLPKDKKIVSVDALKFLMKSSVGNIGCVRTGVLFDENRADGVFCELVVLG